MKNLLFVLYAVFLHFASASVFLFNPETKEQYLKDYENFMIPTCMVYDLGEKEPSFLTAPTEQIAHFLELDEKIQGHFLELIESKKQKYNLHDRNLLIKCADIIYNELLFKNLIKEREKMYHAIIKILPEDEIWEFKWYCSRLDLRRIFSSLVSR